MLCSCACIKGGTTLHIKRMEFPAPRYSRVKSELHSTGENDMTLRYVEPMLFTLMQQLMNAFGVVNGETGCLEEVERWKDRDL